MGEEEADYAVIEAETRRSRPATDTLSRAVGVFLRGPTPVWILVLMGLSVVVRAFAGEWRMFELVAVVIVAAGWPMLEWSAHRWVLHLVPRTVMGVHVDPMFARRHRMHHANPAYFPLVFLPVSVVVGAYVGFAVPVYLVSRDVGFTASLMATISTAALAYEWTHFVAHTDYVPRSRYLSSVVRRHRLHHYRSERRWYAFTVPAVDEWFGTGGEAGATPRSETTRTLGVR